MPQVVACSRMAAVCLAAAVVCRAEDVRSTTGALRTIPTPETENGYLKLDFYWLNFYDFVTPEFDLKDKSTTNRRGGEEQIPATVKGWSGKKVMLRGFMVPTKLENGVATEFILMANLMQCCYASVPKMNDWVIVKVPSGTTIVQDRPMLFRGIFKVGAVWQDGYLTNIYELGAEGPGVVDD